MLRLAENLAQFTGGVIDRGSGVRLHLEDGTELLDFAAGIAVTSTGHSHPHVVQAIQDQVAKILLPASSLGLNRPTLDFLERFGPYLPEGIDRMWFGNIGAEAVETAVRLARQATGRPNIIAFEGGFHGRTMGAASLTSSTAKVRAGISPLMAGVVFAPYPAPARLRSVQGDATDHALEQLDRILATISIPQDTAAFLVEAIQGEGGYVPGTKRFFDGLRERADAHGILLIFDEIQAGWGRTGRFWAFEHFDARPDMIVMGKGMASGLPISALAASKELMDKAWAGSMGGTFSGHVVTAAAALATLDVYEQEELVDNAAVQGQRLIDGLRAVSEGVAEVHEVRGLGLMVGVELRHADGSVGTALAARVQKEAYARGLLILTCGIDRDTMRIVPPLVVEAEDVDRAVQIFGEALHAAVAG
ncbi:MULTISPECIES: aspartate aminotransferase family protein [unclassified Microbacterium]|uniref:aspartate aminotransferase family protein n=1 Tax=unclassified Microbacterium TaxID=2609290 RepID=UPI0030161976